MKEVVIKCDFCASIVSDDMGIMVIWEQKNLSFTSLHLDFCNISCTIGFINRDLDKRLIQAEYNNKQFFNYVSSGSSGTIPVVEPDKIYGAID